MPKFSVLIPTKDRLDLLKEAVETVRRQDYDSWEIIISDNASHDDVVGYARSLEDPRIIATRSEHALSVTENWNRALNASTGDFIIMLGDDDGLMPGYFQKMLAAIEKLGNPELLYHGAFHVAYPGVMSGAPGGYLANVTTFYPILCSGPAVSLIPRDTAQSLAVQSLRFNAEFGYNMQLFLFSRRLIDKLRNYGDVFQGPFPDYYAANVAFLIADTAGKISEPMVMIGISKKSYGNYFFNDREADGVSFLGIEKYLSDAPPDIKDSILPGSNINTSWLISLAPVPKLLNRPDLRIDVQRYRFLQMSVVATSRDNNLKSRMWQRLSPREKIIYALLAAQEHLPRSVARITRRFSERKLQQYARPAKTPPPLIAGKYPDRLSVFDAFSASDEKQAP